MANDKSGLSDQDRALFRAAVGPVKPVKNDRVESDNPRPAPIPRQQIADDRAALRDSLAHDPEQLNVETGDELLFAAPGLQKSVLKKLRRGQFRIEADLDLHGLKSRQAQQLLTRFIADCRSEQRQCVRIVHGKGLRSEFGAPILKPLINEWLRQRQDVLAFSSARPADGGTGAIYVLLRRRTVT